MSGALSIVGLGGSYDEHSRSLAALRIALEGARGDGAQVRLFDVRELSLPMYDPAIEPPPEALALADAVFAAQGMLWSSPLYHGTISGSFKNALDWLELLGDRDPAYLTDKVIGLISAAGGTQGLNGVNTMEYVVRALRGWAVPLVLPIPRVGSVFASDGSVDPGIRESLLMLGSEVARAARRLSASPVTSREAQAVEQRIDRE
jgi:FMN reductase